MLIRFHAFKKAADGVCANAIIQEKNGIAVMKRSVKRIIIVHLSFKQYHFNGLRIYEVIN